MGASNKIRMGYRILTYTSKNEFYVIDVNKMKMIKQRKLSGQKDTLSASSNQSSRILSKIDDIGISTMEKEFE